MIYDFSSDSTLGLIDVDSRSPAWSESLKCRGSCSKVLIQISLQIHFAEMNENIHPLFARESFENVEIERT